MTVCGVFEGIFGYFHISRAIAVIITANISRQITALTVFSCHNLMVYMIWMQIERVNILITYDRDRLRFFVCVGHEKTFSENHQFLTNQR